nr:hypothetical protein [Nostoc parmelioides]
MAITNLIRFNNLRGDIFAGDTAVLASGVVHLWTWGSLWRLFCRAVWR